MVLHESQKCPHCGRFVFNADMDLPFEIVSTGAFIMNMKLQLDINCGHCHRSHVYTVGPTPFRVDK